jgi:hypothetical protein
MGISSVCLFMSNRAMSADSILLAGICLMVARLCGLLALATGGIAIYNRSWLEGTLLFLGSVGLPMISLFYHGHL